LLIALFVSHPSAWANGSYIEKLGHAATCVFGEWLQILPAATRGEPPDVGSFMHRNVATVAFAEHFPLCMVGHRLRCLAMASPSGPINHCEM
jgi:hypothetical protein